MVSVLHELLVVVRRKGIFQGEKVVVFGLIVAARTKRCRRLVQRSEVRSERKLHRIAHTGVCVQSKRGPHVLGQTAAAKEVLDTDIVTPTDTATSGSRSRTLGTRAAHPRRGGGRGRPLVREHWQGALAHQQRRTGVHSGPQGIARGGEALLGGVHACPRSIIGIKLASAAVLVIEGTVDQQPSIRIAKQLVLRVLQSVLVDHQIQLKFIPVTRKKK